MSFFTTRAYAPKPKAQFIRHHNQIRQSLDLIRRTALFSSPPAPPAESPCYEYFPRWRLVPLRRGDVAPPASPDGHLRCRVAELRAGSETDAWGPRPS